MPVPTTYKIYAIFRDKLKHQNNQLTFVLC